MIGRDDWLAVHHDDVEFTDYHDARPKVFNGTNRTEVFADLLGWLDRIIPA